MAIYHVFLGLGGGGGGFLAVLGHLCVWGFGFRVVKVLFKGCKGMAETKESEFEQLLRVV